MSHAHLLIMCDTTVVISINWLFQDVLEEVACCIMLEVKINPDPLQNTSN